MSLMAEQLSPFTGGPAPLQWDQGQSSRETLKTQTPTGSTHLHTHHTNTHTQGPTRHTRQRPSLPLARVLHLSPFPSHWFRPRGGERPASHLHLVQRLQQVVAGKGAGLQGTVGPVGKKGSVQGWVGTTHTGGAQGVQAAAEASFPTTEQGPFLRLETCQDPFF